MAFTNYCFLFAIVLFHSYRLAIADSIQGCGGFVEASQALIKSRKLTDAKLDYSHVMVELGHWMAWLRTERNVLLMVTTSFRFMTSFSFPPLNVQPLTSSNPPYQAYPRHVAAEFLLSLITLVVHLIWESCGSSFRGSCSRKSGGPSNVNVELSSPNGNVVSSVSTTSTGNYSFKNIIPGKYKIGASRRDLIIEIKGSEEVELGFDNGVVDDIFFASGYDIRGYVVAQIECKITKSQYATQVFSVFGTYKLIPFYKGENTVFDVSPPSMLVSVQHDHVIVPQKFQVTGFSVGGRVVDGNGNGVDAATILVDGLERSITDTEGYYKLDQVTSKGYSIEAIKEHYKFERLNDFLVLPNMVSIIDIKAVSYDICGSAQTVSSAYKAKVALTHGPKNVKPQVKQTDESGNFCFEVPPGEYRLSAFAALPESAPELLFSPHYIDVIVNKPLLDIKFYQAQVNVRGSVVCKDKCGPAVSVMLVRLDGQELFPGTKSGEDIWCWEQNIKNVNVGVEDVEGITFIQKGYWVSVNSSHDVDAYLKGSQQICVESSGVHELHFIDSCISFGISTLRIDTSNQSPIYLKGEKYLLKGHINVESKENLPENIPLDILDNQETLVDGTIARLVSAEVDQSGAAVYEYSVWANFGGKLIFVPRDSRVLAQTDSHISTLKQGDTALEITTRADGVFLAGPLYDDIAPAIDKDLFFPGYYVKQTGQYSYSCQNLGQIFVRLYSREDSNEPFPSVLLSLSGEDGYRNNSVTGVGGTFMFDNLFPGSFYLRPLLKSFNGIPFSASRNMHSPLLQRQSTLALGIKEVVFYATRVAFSAMGKVTLLSGQPKEGVSVEARAESKGFYEETITDSSGCYRLRGLQPDTTYVIKIARKGELHGMHIERASPESLNVKVGFEDIKELDFVVFELPDVTILSGHVEGKNFKELRSHIRVEIRSADDPSRLSPSFLCQFQTSFSVDLERQPQIHVGPLSYRIDEDIYKQELAPAPVYPLVDGVSVMALFISMPRSSVTAKKDVKKLAVRTKTY
ncbi:hypothetical protein DH2020_009542 [Rehmannia glutinosa]|uniref:Uncharacterized protein n=1 Tax=Rehmannia glutinosa TaxID=99300 RepID=A0ABR0X9C4_REHGL